MPIDVSGRFGVDKQTVGVIGGGAAGFFGAIAAANPHTNVTLYEAGGEHSPVSKAVVVEGAGQPDDLDLDAIKASYEQADYVETDDEGLGLGPRGLGNQLYLGELDREMARCTV